MFRFTQAPLSRLSTSVGNRHTSNPSDVTNTRSNFANLGRFDGDTELPILDSELDQTIRKYQRDKGLREDGLMSPGGETERALNRDLLRFDAEFPSEHGNPMPLNISASVGNNRVNHNNDVQKVQSYLGSLGLVSEAKQFEPNGIIDRETVDGISRFQSQNGLRQDGFMNPGGETEVVMNYLTSKGDDGGDKEPPPPSEGGDNPPPPPEGNDPDKLPPKPEEKPPVPDEDKPPPKPEKKPKPPKENDCSSLEVAVSNAESMLEQAQEVMEKEEAEIESERESLESKVADIQSELDSIMASRQATDNAVTGISVGAGAFAGGILGFGVGNAPGSVAGAVAGGKLGNDAAGAIKLGLAGEIAAKQQAIDALQSQIDTLDVKLQSLQSAVDEAQALLSDAQSALDACQMQGDG